ncbi:MAG: hypothetical protein LBI67_05590 [Treponema sp.]|jgi:NACalpha-BTF3-like transcription factor|nr:hypothetical protein [Treponema sp.]
MDCTVRVANEKAREIYIKELSDVNDPRQVMNKLRRARNIIEKPCVSTIHIAGDKNTFRVGREDDIKIWLEQRIKEFNRALSHRLNKGGETGASSALSPADGSDKRSVAGATGGD